MTKNVGACIHSTFTSYFIPPAHVKNPVPSISPLVNMPFKTKTKQNQNKAMTSSHINYPAVSIGLVYYHWVFDIDIVHAVLY